MAGDLSPADAAHAAGKLLARPHPPVAPAKEAGTLRLDPNGGGRDGLLHVPASYGPGRAMGLLLLLHGAGGSGERILSRVRDAADRAGLIVIAPDSVERSWDIVGGEYGPDVASIDRALGRVFDRYDVDPARVVIGGFSDGASYALSLGPTNGRLFAHIVAFSPGFAAPGALDGRPPIFVSHGTRDEILPIDRASRRLVPALRDKGYDVHYIEFDDGHRLRDDTIRAAFDWLAAK
jgi:phospholipase/carboxylesterase